jgi:hypothetical protein
MSAPPQAIAPNLHTNLLNVYIKIANKIGFQQKNFLYASVNFRDVAKFKLLQGYRHFGGILCLHLQCWKSEPANNTLLVARLNGAEVLAVNSSETSGKLPDWIISHLCIQHPSVSIILSLEDFVAKCVRI